MSIVEAGDLIRIFFKYPISYIPIVDENTVGDTYLVGFLSRKKVLHYSSDKERLNNKFERIPDFFLSKEIYPEHIWEFFEKAPIPVYNIFAKFIDTWQKNEINYHLKHFIYTLQSNIFHEDKKETNETTIDYEKRKLLEMILSSLPFPILAIDTNGNGIFYNELFLKDIVDKGPFKKTLALAESYFKEAIRKVLADYIIKNLNTEYMIWDWKEYHKRVYVTNLIENNQIYAYLLTFLPYVDFASSKDLKTPGDLSQEKSNFILFIEEQLNKNNNYDECIDALESQIIENYLMKYHYNITNTANALKIKRTTLQNKIKKLKLQKSLSSLQNNNTFIKNELQSKKENHFNKQDQEIEKIELKKILNEKNTIQDSIKKNHKTKKKSKESN